MSNDTRGESERQSSHVAPEEAKYDKIGSPALIVRFYESGLDQEIGRVLSARLLAHAGYPGDPSTEPLNGRDGKQVEDSDTGKSLTLADYVNYAAEHHFYALEGILDFLHTQPGEADYEKGRAAYEGYIGANRPQAGGN
jgi:hypothetical protein